MYPLTDTLTGLNGQYLVGMCGQLTAGGAGWDQVDWAYTTAQVIGGASVLTSFSGHRRPRAAHE